MVMTDGKPLDDLAGDFDEAAFIEAFEELGGDGPVDGLPLQLDPTGPALERYMPPPLPFDVEMDHLVGGDVLTILPSNPQDRGTRDLDREILRLPRSLGSIVRSLKNGHHRCELAGFIERAVRKAVPPDATSDVEVPGAIYKTSYVLEIHRRAALTKLAADAAFITDLKSRVDLIKRQGHLVNTYGGPPSMLPELPACAVPPTGTWNAESWVGLSTSSLPEAVPEEVAVAIAQRTWRGHHLNGRARKHPVGRVLHWGALNSTLAFALVATAPRGLTLEIDEVDTVGQPRSSEWRGRRTTTLPKAGEYDLVVVHAPPPGEGANHIRNLYKAMNSQPEGDLHLEDLGRRGPRKWRRGLLRLISQIMLRVKSGGELVLLLPMAVRTAPRVDGFVQWGYEPRLNLLEGVVDLLSNRGFGILADLEVVEKNPISQPFFLERRCPWRFVIASRSRCTEHGIHNRVNALPSGLETDLG